VTQPGAHPIGTPTAGISPHTGPMASAAWLAARDLIPLETKWSATITFDGAEHHGTDPTVFDEATGTRFRIDIFAEEWGYQFCYRGRSSWIRVTDVRFAHGRDEHELLAVTPPLREIGRLLTSLESRYDIAFPRHAVDVTTTIKDGVDPIKRWALDL
jgi:hypothetical protein